MLRIEPGSIVSKSKALPVVLYLSGGPSSDVLFGAGEESGSHRAELMGHSW